MLPGIGGPGYNLDFDDFDNILAQIKAVEKPCRVIAFSLPGTNSDTKLKCEYTLHFSECVSKLRKSLPTFKQYNSDKFASIFSERVDTLGLENIIVIGTSYSSRIATLMTKYTSSIKKLVLTNPIPLNSSEFIPEPVINSMVLEKVIAACKLDFNCQMAEQDSGVSLIEFKESFETVSYNLKNAAGTYLLKSDEIETIKSILSRQGPIAVVEYISKYSEDKTIKLSATENFQTSFGLNDNGQSGYNRIHFEAVMCNDFNELSNPIYKQYSYGVYGRRWGDSREFECTNAEPLFDKSFKVDIPVEIYVDAFDPLISPIYILSYLDHVSCMYVTISKDGTHFLIPNSVFNLTSEIYCAPKESIAEKLFENSLEPKPNL